MYRVQAAAVPPRLDVLQDGGKGVPLTIVDLVVDREPGNSGPARRAMRPIASLLRTPILLVLPFLFGAACASTPDTPAQQLASERWEKCRGTAAVTLREIRPDGQIWYSVTDSRYQAFQECERRVAAEQRARRVTSGPTPESAVVVKDRSVVHSEDDNSLIDAGNAYATKGDQDRAIQAYDQAIRANPRYAIAFYNRGLAYAAKSEWDRAVRDYDEAIRLDPQYTFAFLTRGNAYHAKGDPDRAMQDYGEAIRLDPRYAMAFNNRGITYADRRDWDRAVRDYDEAIRLDPRHVLALNNRGNAYRAKGEPERAMQDYDEAIRLDPLSPMAFNNRGLLHADRRAWDRAIQDYDEAIRLDPRRARAFINRGNAYRAKGEEGRAIEDYEGAIRDGL